MAGMSAGVLGLTGMLGFVFYIGASLFLSVSIFHTVLGIGKLYLFKKYGERGDSTYMYQQRFSLYYHCILNININTNINIRASFIYIYICRNKECTWISTSVSFTN